MRRAVEVYAERFGHPSNGGRWTSGSGYLLASRLVLTAAHTVCPDGPPASVVRVRAESRGLVTARVIWHRDDGVVDAALLEITDPGWVEPRWRHPVRLGRFVTGRAGQACEAVGFPRVVATPERRDTHHAVGVLNPRSLVKSGLYALEVTNPPSAPGPDGSGWQGMSGAAVQSAGLLIGVVAVDPAGFDSRRLVVVPVTLLTADPRFTELITEHTGTAPLLRPVELLGLAHEMEPASSPAELLRADVAAVPFRDRPELSQLLDWCHDPAWSSVRLVAGPGGQGKTRLARHLATQLHGDNVGDPTEAGWASVVLAEHLAAHDLAVLSEVVVPTLVVVDYAEARPAQLDPLLRELSRAETRVRLLLLARTAGAWRAERVTPAAHLGVLADDRIVVELSPVEPAPAGRQQAWRDAAAALAPRLAWLPGYEHIPWPALAGQLQPPRMDDRRYRTILAVQMDALAALLQAGDPVPNPMDAGGVRDARAVLLDHEHRYWTRVADRFGITLTPATRRCLVAIATLWGATTEIDARQMLAAARPDMDAESIVNVADWLAALYRDGERYWSGLQPDPLAEYLIGTTVGPRNECTSRVADTYPAVSSAQLEHGFTVLGRAHSHHPSLSQIIGDAVLSGGEAGARAAITVAPRLERPEPLLAALDRFVDQADIAELESLDAAFPRFSLLFGLTKLRTAERLSRHYRAAATTNDGYLPALALSVHNLAIRLAEAGRRAEVNRPGWRRGS